MIAMAIILAMIVFFIHSTTWDDGIFEGIRKIIPEKWKISKIIYSCPICMTPYWGTIFYLLLFGWGGWQEWIATIGCASGISVFSVIANYVKDYCKSRTRDLNECC